MSATSYLINPETLGDGPKIVVNVGISFLVLAWTSVLLRVWVRTYMIKAFGWDDWTILVTLGLFTAEVGVIIYATNIETSPALKEAIGQGIVEELPYLAHLARLVLLVVAFYLWVTVMLKISLAIFFLRIISTPWQRNFIIANTALYTFFGVALSFIGLFECGSPNDFVSNLVNDRCISAEALGPINYTAGVYNALIDWLYVFLPLYVVWNAKIPLRGKLTVCVLLGFAAVGSIASLIRIDYISGLKRTDDFYGRAVGISVWSMIEPGLGIFAVSLASLRPLFKAIYEMMLSLKSISLLSMRRRTKSNGGTTDDSSVIRASPTTGGTPTTGRQSMVEDIERQAGLENQGHNLEKTPVVESEGPLPPPETSRASGQSQNWLMEHEVPPEE